MYGSGYNKMPITKAETGTPVWTHRTSKTRLAIWTGWLLLVALFIFCWQVMTEGTMWFFVYDAPRQAADIGSRMFPPKWSYMEELWWPLWDTINIATLGTLLAVIMAVPVAFFAARSLAVGLIGGSTSVTAAGIGIGVIVTPACGTEASTNEA